MIRFLISPWHNLWRHRELLWQFILRNIEVRHKGSHLGLIWSFLSPLLMLSLYVLVFGYIFGGKFGILASETRADYALGIFLSLTIFHIIAEVLAGSPSLIVGNPNFVKKVIFPLDILPAANVGAACFHFLISLSLAIVGIICFGPGLSLNAFWLPIILVPIILLLLGIGWFFSALGVFLRDVGQIIQFLTLALMYSSCVFYSPAKLPSVAWQFLRFNPILLAIETARDAMLWHRPVNLNHLIYLYIAGLVVCYAGHAAFSRMKPAFADVL